jgi:glutamate dehydrogenase
MLRLVAGHAAYQPLPDRPRRCTQALPGAQDGLPPRCPGCRRPVPSTEMWVCSPQVEGIHLRFGQGRARRPAMVGPSRGLPHRGAGPGQGPSREELRDRAGRGEGRVRAQGSATRTHGVATSRLHRVHPRAARPHRQPCRGRCRTARRMVPPPRQSCAATDDDTVPGGRRRQGHRHDVRRRQRREHGDYHYWLGDAFASGGSAGYDHKAMGITARGSLGVGAPALPQPRPQTSRAAASHGGLTVVGIGDMSGDVFGNAMLLSRGIRPGRRVRPPAHLPRPRPRPVAVSFDERRRLFDLPALLMGRLRPRRSSPPGAACGRGRRSRCRSRRRFGRGSASDASVDTHSPPPR